MSVVRLPVSAPEVELHPLGRPEVQAEVLQQARAAVLVLLGPAGCGRISLGVEADYRGGRVVSFRLVATGARSAREIA